MHTEVQVFLYPKITGKKSEKFALVKICYDFQRNYLLLLFYFENFTMFNTFPKLSALEAYTVITVIMSYIASNGRSGLILCLYRW